MVEPIPEEGSNFSASDSPLPPDTSLTGSLSLPAGSWTDPFPEIPTEELEAKVKAAEEEMMYLKCEMEMYEKYLAKANSKQQQEEDTGLEESVGPRRRRHSRQQRGNARTVADQLQLTMHQKCDVAAVCLDDMKTGADRVRLACQEELCDVQAAMEEVKQRGQELRITEYEFRRGIVEGAVVAATGKVRGEVVERYFQDRLASRDVVMEQLMRKDARLAVAQAKVEAQRRQREESGEVLHEVDFRQLQIENTQIVDKTKERNAEMLRLKVSAGNLMQVLNDHTQQLQRIHAAGRRLGEEIRARKGLLQRLVDESESVEEQRQAAQESNGKLRRLIESHRVAPVLEYVRESAAQSSLAREVATMERKVDVAKGELKRCRQQPARDAASASATARVAFGSSMPRSAPARGRWG